MSIPSPHTMSCQTMCFTVGLTDFGGGARGGKEEAENIVQFTLTLFSPAAGTSYTTKPSDPLINTYWGRKKNVPCVLVCTILQFVGA